MTATVRGISVEGRDGEVDRDGHRKYALMYYVTTDDRNDGPQQVENAFGLPRRGDIYVAGNDLNMAAVVVDVQARQRADSPWEWDVRVRYDTNVTKDPDQPDNPLEQPPTISYGSQVRRVLIPGRYNVPAAPNLDGDYDLGITAPNGMLYDPQPEMDIADPVLSISRFVASVDAGEVMSWANCVNRSVFMGCRERTLKMNGPQIESLFHKELGTYWRLSVSMVYRYEKWDVQLLNQSDRYIDGSGDMQPFKDSEGHGRVGLLTSTGGALNSTAAKSTDYGRYTTSGNDPTFTRLRVYREIDFGALGLI